MQRSHRSRTTALSERALVLVFLLAIALPGARASLDGWRHTNAAELRDPAPWPDATGLPAFGEQFEAFFGDRLGFRAALVTLHGFVKARLLHASPNPQVLLGREDWLFFNGSRDLRERDRIVHQARGARRLDEAELDALEAMLEDRRAFCRAAGAPYLLVVAPNKHTLYREYLPPAMNRVADTTPLDQLFARLAAKGSVPFLDLRPPLRAGRQRGLVYYRTDSHWNDLGARIATAEILRALARWLPSLPPPPPLDAFAVRWTSAPGSTLATMIALGPYYGDSVPVLTPPRAPRARRLSEEEVFGSRWFDERPRLRDWFVEEGLVFTIYETPDADLPEAVFLVDSFGAWLMEPLAEHFHRSTFLHRRTPRGLVARVVRDLAPDVVVEEMVERSLVAE